LNQQIVQLDLSFSWAFGVKWSPSGNTLAYVGQKFTFLSSSKIKFLHDMHFMKFGLFVYTLFIGWIYLLFGTSS
jgi:hypothetical protein